MLFYFITYKDFFKIILFNATKYILVAQPLTLGEKVKIILFVY